MVLPILLLAVPSIAAGSGAIVIRSYDASGLDDDTLAAALAGASTIFDSAGVATTWLACDRVVAAAAGHPCLAPLQRHELAVRLVRLPARERCDGTEVRRCDGAVTLGYSLVETKVRFGSLATIYMDRISDLAAASRVEPATLLGRAIAHEIGHLLLGTDAHAPAGVMRALWSSEALRQTRTGDWAFTPHDARALREAARRRSAAGLATW
ncbi:MAG: hypothetical protein HYY76_20230 [Acidobacteria bacterium]|nr:hypothetical protein [Acidobacteriota bacterium]